MPLIGTAGHVDHGKSTLVERLTGRDPDRWAEEKRRGLTIDLGFAWATLPNGLEVSFVDVPGHARFLKNMLAGIEAIDVALMVVAADEGWKPQSEEHLAVLDLLEVRHGVVAVTKIDLVDPELAELARLEVSDHLAGTTLAGVEVIPVSARTGAGIGDLVAELARLSAMIDQRDLDRPRLWIDRSFSVAGAGTVVTGTLLDGSVTAEDQLQVYPSLAMTRVRGIESHEVSHRHIGPGRRVAMALSGVERDEMWRGVMLGRPGQWRLSDRFTARLRLARYVDDLPSRGAYQLHIGSGSHRLELTAVDGEVAILRIDESAPVASGDRFVIRDTGRRLVVAGGRVLDPAPGSTGPALSAANLIRPEMGPDETATALLALRGFATVIDLSADSAGGTPRKGRQVGETWLAEGVFESLSAQAGELVRSHHEAHPLRVGLPMATLAERLGVDADIVEAVVAETAGLERDGPDVRVAGRGVVIPDDSQAQWVRIRDAMSLGLDVPTIAELGADPEMIHLLIRDGELVRISDELVILAEQADEIRHVLRDMPSGFTVAQFRDRMALSRKYAVPYLEWADREGLTIRRGDTRTLR